MVVGRPAAGDDAGVMCAAAIPSALTGRLRVAGLATLAGLCIVAAVPPWGWWPLAIVGFALVDRLVAGVADRRRRFVRGWIVGLAWLLPGTVWMLDFTLPGYLIAALVYGALLGVAAAATPPGPARLAGLPATVVLFELIRWSWPFGGVPLATLPMGQVGGPLGPVVRVLGPLQLSALVVLAGLGLAAAWDRRVRTALLAFAIVVGSVLVAAIAPRGTAVGELDVAVVQGGGPQRTRADTCQNRAVFERHLAASALIDTPVDLVVWPENVVNPELPSVVDRGACPAPLLYIDEAGEQLSDLARSLDAVLLPGWFHALDDDENVNYTTAVAPDGSVVDRYDKVRLVPFGEFVPLRGLLEKVVGDALPARDVRPGTGAPVLATPVGPIGVAISWEIFFDHRVRAAVADGAELVVNPTNGSSYWLSIVQTQQVASSRLRALETGRWVLQAAPTGFSAIVAPDGTVVARTAISEQAVLQERIERRDGRTLATRVGAWPMAVLALVALAGAWWYELRHPIRRPPPAATGPASGPIEVP